MEEIEKTMYTRRKIMLTSFKCKQKTSMSIKGLMLMKFKEFMRDYR